jgi:PAS domain S-box-containing protein
MAPIAGWLDQISCAGAIVAVVDAVLTNVLLASWADDWWMIGLAAVVALVVFSLLYASKIEAGRKHVDDLERAMRALAASEERFRTLCDHAPVGIFIDDGDGNGIYHNAQCAEITGIALEEAQGTGWRSTLHPDDRERVVQRVNEAVRNQQPYQDSNRYLHADGTVRWAEGNAVPVRDPNGELVAYIGTLLDVTAKRDLVEAQQASEFRYRAIVNDQTDLIVRWQPDGTLLFANEAWCEFQGCTLEESFGIDFLSVVPEQRRDELRNWVAAVTVGLPVVSEESRFQMPDGRRYIQVWTEHAIFDELGNLIEIQSVGRDITAERDAEEQFREQLSLLAHVSRLSTMGELVAGIAHEVNQPLYSIKNCAQALQNVLADDSTEDRELMVQCADQISEASSRAGEMIRRLRNFVRHGETEREVCDLNVLVEEAVRLVGFEASRQEASVIVRKASRSLLVRVDHVQIQQVLVNLLKNAFEAVAAAECETREVVASCDESGSAGRITIKDSGAGVPPDLRESIFDPFVTTRREGMGMGLAISRTIIEGHGGQIQLGQDDAEGASFHVELPLFIGAIDDNDADAGSETESSPTAKQNTAAAQEV